MTQNQIVISDEDEDEEHHARVALVMRDTSSYQPEPNASDNTDPQKPTKGFVWAEARITPSDVDNSPQQESPMEVLSISQVAVTPVEIDNETFAVDDCPASSATDSPDCHECEELDNDEEAALEDPDDMVSVPPSPTTCSLYHWNFIVFVFGNTLLLAATATTFGMEVSGSLLYIAGTLFYWVAEAFSRVGAWTVLFQTLFRLLSVLLLSFDLILLTVSTLLVELMAWLAGILCILFGGITVGIGMHQHIRRVTFLVSQTIRKFHSNWNPQRMEPFVFRDGDDDNVNHHSSEGGDDPTERVVMLQ